MNAITRGKWPHFDRFLTHRCQIIAIWIPAYTVHLPRVSLEIHIILNINRHTRYYNKKYCWIILLFSLDFLKFSALAHTCNECICLSVSTSKRDTTLPDAAARRCPILGWNLTCVDPPCLNNLMRFRKENTQNPSHLREKNQLNLAHDLKNASARILTNIPKANLIVIITGTEKVSFHRVEIKGCHMWGMTTICLQWKAWLQN